MSPKPSEFFNPSASTCPPVSRPVAVKKTQRGFVRSSKPSITPTSMSDRSAGVSPALGRAFHRHFRTTTDAGSMPALHMDDHQSELYNLKSEIILQNEHRKKHI